MVADASFYRGVFTGTSQVTFGNPPVNDGGPFTLALLVDTSDISNPDPPPNRDVDIYPTDLSNMNLRWIYQRTCSMANQMPIWVCFFTGLDTVLQSSPLVQGFTLDDFTEATVTDEVSGIAVAIVNSDRARNPPMRSIKL